MPKPKLTRAEYAISALKPPLFKGAIGAKSPTKSRGYNPTGER